MASVNACHSYGEMLWYADGTTAPAVSSPGLAQLTSSSIGTTDDKFQTPKKPPTTV